MRICQWPQQNRVDDTENGAVRTDRESQRQDGDESEAGRLGQHPYRVSNVGDHNLFAVTERDHGISAGGAERGHVAGQQRHQRERKCHQHKCR